MQDYTYYNDRVNAATVELLLELNRQFYFQRGRDFADTRCRVQPGVLRVIANMERSESILDLGCGSGNFARELSRAGHHGAYLGIDSSMTLLKIAMSSGYAFPVDFLQADITQLPCERPAAAERSGANPGHSPQGDTNELPPARRGWSVISAFAALHHIPGHRLRVQLLKRARQLLGPRGRLVLSNWQFTSSGRLRKRIRPWSTLGTALELDPGDYLLDWRRGQLALRYVHEFDEPELGRLAAECGFEVLETFYSDGANHASGLYQWWRPS